MCLSAHAHRQRLGLQAIAVAGGAGDGGEIALHVLARQVAFGLAPAPLEIVHHALERLFRLEAAHAVVIDEAHVVLAAAVQDHFLGALGQILPRDIGLELVDARQRVERLGVIGRRAPGPRRDRALAQRLGLVGDHQIRVDLLLGAEPAARRAGAVRRVERKQPRLDLGNREAGNRAGEFGGEDQAVGIVLLAEFHSFFPLPACGERVSSSPGLDPGLRGG